MKETQAGRWDKGAWLALLFLVTTSGCRSCADSSAVGSMEGSVEGTAPAGSTPLSLRSPEPWTLGATRRQPGLALPPPCVPRADSLRGVLSRETWIAAEPQTLGKALVAEGTMVPKWHLDSAGLMTMTHGRTAVVPMPWLGDDAPLLAYAGADDRWLVGPAPRHPGEPTLWLWRGGVWERLATGPDLAAAGTLCDAGACAVLCTPLGAPLNEGPGQRPGRGGASVLLGRADEALHSWARFDVASNRPEGVPLGVEAIEQLGDEDWQVTVTMKDDLRVQFFRVARGKPAQLAAVIDAPQRALDAVLYPSPMAMTAQASPAPRPCAPEGGGVTIATERRKTQLRSALPATGGALRPLTHGVLALWSAPSRCEARDQTLYGAVLRSDGSPVAPVTPLAQADDYAVSSTGDQVDLWVVHDRRVTWVRARCPVPR